MSRIGKSVETERRFMIAQDWVGRGMGEGVTPNRCGDFLGDDENVLKLIVVMFVQLCEYTKIHWVVYFK